jgi:hypothetical protein
MTNSTNEPRARASDIPVWCSHDKLVDITELIENPRNPNKHPDKQIALLAKIIRSQGWRQPITVSNRSGFIVKGHGRLQAAKVMAVELAPVDYQDYATEAEEYADLIADNRIAELAEPDAGMIGDLLKDTMFEDFDLDLTGFDEKELGSMLSEPGEGLTDEDDVPEVPDEPVAKLGQIWRLGDHRLMCGDSTNSDNIAQLVDGARVDLLLTDPPYGIDYGGLLKGKGDGKGGADKNGWKSHDAPEWDKVRPESRAFDAMLSLAENSIIWGGNYFADLIPPTMGWLIWDKGQRGFSLADGEMAWTSFQNALRIKSYARAHANREEKHHPTQKPVEIMEWCLEYADRHSKGYVAVVLDVYLGSGTTMLTCEKVGKKCLGIELDPKYCDVIIKRWEDYTGKKAELIDG